MYRLVLVLAVSLIFSILGIAQVYAVELTVLESQLNKNSITGILQNPYDYEVSGIEVRAEFYGKDGNLVGLRNFYDIDKTELAPNEKSSFKIFEHAGETGEFPKTDFIVKAEGYDNTNMEEVSIDELIEDIDNLTRSLNAIPREITTTITQNVTGTNATGTNVEDLNVEQMNVEQMNVTENENGGK
jgi:hypothetical protein